MQSLATDLRVRVHPFHRRPDESGGIIVGSEASGAVLSVPERVLEILDSLAEGRTVGEVAEAYLARHGKQPDMDGLLSHLAAKGFVSVLSPSGGPREAASHAAAPDRAAPRLTYHFTSIPESVARTFFGPTAQVAALTLVLTSAGLAALDPGLLPGWRALVFERNAPSLLLALMLVGLAATFLHELAHLVAARARGVGSRLGIGHRLWILVAETDMTGIWRLPSRQRYLPILAGPLLDVVSAAVIIWIRAAARWGWTPPLPPAVDGFLAAMFYTYWLRVLWQCFLFLRTDFYYALATALNCKNLMGDTETFMRNKVLRLVGRAGVDQRGIPAREMRIIRYFSVPWLGGRLLALWVLFMITLPLFAEYLGRIALLLAGLNSGGGDRPSALLVLLVTLAFGLTGLGLWLKNLFATGAK